MSTEVLLPKIGFAMNDAVLSQWLVADGAQVTAGEPLYSIQSAMSDQEIEAPPSGKLKILAAIGETYLGGTVLAEIL